MEQETIGARLRSLRKQKDMTIEEVARHLNLASSVIGMYEINRRVPPPDKLQLLADFYGVSVDYLLGRTNRPDHVPEPPAPYAIPITQVPLLGRVPAGRPILTEQNIEGYVPAPEGLDCDFAVRVYGDSMEGAG